jgi:hypothetical protein
MSRVSRRDAAAAAAAEANFESAIAEPRKKAAPPLKYSVGDKVQVRYLASSEGSAKRPAWYDATVRAADASSGTYDVDFDDGDEERGVTPANIRDRQRRPQSAGPARASGALVDAVKRERPATDEALVRSLANSARPHSAPGMHRRTLRAERPSSSAFEPVLKLPDELTGILAPQREASAAREYEFGIFAQVRNERSTAPIHVSDLREEVMHLLEPKLSYSGLSKAPPVFDACCEDVRAQAIIVGALKEAAANADWREIWVLLGQVSGWLQQMIHINDGIDLPWWVRTARAEAGNSQGVDELVDLTAEAPEPVDLTASEKQPRAKGPVPDFDFAKGSFEGAFAGSVPSFTFTGSTEPPSTSESTPTAGSVAALNADPPPTPPKSNVFETQQLDAAADDALQKQRSLKVEKALAREGASLQDFDEIEEALKWLAIRSVANYYRDSGSDSGRWGSSGLHQGSPFGL